MWLIHPYLKQLPPIRRSPGPRALSHLPGEFAGLKGGFDFRRFWHSFVERIWIVALCVLAGLFIALGYLARTPKLYQGHTVLEVDFQEPTLLTTGDSARMRPTFLASQEALRTIEQNLTNQNLLARVIRSEGLAKDDGARAFRRPKYYRQQQTQPDAEQRSIGGHEQN